MIGRKSRERKRALKPLIHRVSHSVNDLFQIAEQHTSGSEHVPASAENGGNVVDVYAARTEGSLILPALHFQQANADLHPVDRKRKIDEPLGCIGF